MSTHVADAHPVHAAAMGPSHVAALRRWLAAVVLALVGVLLAAMPASADGDPSTDVIRSVDVAVTVRADGTVHVEETYQWDFGSRNGLGFYRDLVQRMGYDSTHVRLYEYSNFAVTSPSGAPADVWVESDGYESLRLAVGAPDGSTDTRTGVQTYVLSYDVRGAINAIRGQAGVGDQDEFYWNIFTGFANPFEAVRVTVTGPTAVVDVACYSGPQGSSTPCTSYNSSGDSATFAQDGIPVGDNLTVTVGFTPGVITGTDPILEDSSSTTPGQSGTTAPSFLERNWAPLAGGYLGLLAIVVTLRVRHGRDRYFTQVPPGVIPAPGQNAAVAVLTRAPAVAVRFTPPDGLTPAEADLLERERVGDESFAATVVDLAVRGYLTLAEKPQEGLFGSRDWVLTRVENGPDAGRLQPFERQVMRSLFRSRSSVTISQLRGTFTQQVEEYGRTLTAVSDSNGWFQRPGLLGKPARRSIRTWITMIVLAAWIPGFVVTFWARDNGGATVSSIAVAVVVALVSLGIVLAATAKASHGRSALGRARYEQVRGFREYLTTAEADQIRFEAGEDVFSRYLPWAMVFGVSDRWTQIFEDLAARGLYEMPTYWYVGSITRGPQAIADVGRAVSGFSSSGMSSLTYTPGSSGGSGSFGGGGGFSGGGGGGGGGGGR